jgi:hypothetical protein
MANPRKPATEKMRNYRERLRAAGLRPIQVWVPDVRSPDFARKLDRQVAALNRRHESDVMDFIEHAGDDSDS